MCVWVHEACLHTSTVFISCVLEYFDDDGAEALYDNNETAP